jgi:hypothetical protein
MSFLSNRFREKSGGLPQWAALDEQALLIAAVMEHLQGHGNLDSFPASQTEKLALMKTARRQGLVRWNRRTRRYELSSLRRERSGTRRALRESDGRTDPPPPASLGKRWTLDAGPIIAAVAGLAIGAGGMALLSGSRTRGQATVAAGTKASGASDLRAGTQAPVPLQEPVWEPQNAPTATPARPGGAGAVEGAATAGDRPAAAPPPSASPGE